MDSPNPPKSVQNTIATCNVDFRDERFVYSFFRIQLQKLLCSFVLELEASFLKFSAFENPENDRRSQGRSNFMKARHEWTKRIGFFWDTELDYFNQSYKSDLNDCNFLLQSLLQISGKVAVTPALW